jgi:hypothetical protein
MPWTTPETFTAGQTLTAASMNALSGNDGFLYTPPMVRLTRTGTGNANNATWTSVTYDGGASFDTDSMYSSGAQTRITINTAGIYLVIGGIGFASNATGFRGARLIVSGATVIAIDSRPPVNGDTTIITLSTLYEFTAGQYVECQAFQSSGGVLSVGASPGSHFSAQFIGEDV